MRFLMNENISGTVIRMLRERGHDVFSVKESLRGANDETVLALARNENRILITQDKDFGGMVFQKGLKASCGIILFRLSGKNPETDNQTIIDALESRDDWAGNFAVITETHVRFRPLPN